MIPYNKRQDAQIVKIKDYINGKREYVTGEGTSLTLENTANTSFNNIILKGNTSQQQYSGKNLVPITAKSLERNGVTFTINNNQLTINGTATKYTIFFLNNEIWSYSANNPILEAGTYNLSFNNEIKSSGDAMAITIYNENSKIIYEKAGIKNNFSFSISEKGSCTIRMVITKGQVFDNNDLQLQIEQGSTATDYEPYVGGVPSPNPDYPQDINVVTGDNKVTISNADNTKKQEFLINLGDIELCKIGDYQDYIYKKDDKWLKHRKIGKIKLSSSEMKNTYKMSKVYSYNFYDNSVKNDGVGICNYYQYSQQGNWNATEGTKNFIINSIGHNIRFTNGEIEDKSEDFKKFIDSNNIYVYYQVATPTEEEITDTTLITQLNALYNAYTYNDTTNITQTNANLPFYINAEAFKKL